MFMGVNTWVCIGAEHRRVCSAVYVKKSGEYLGTNGRIVADVLRKAYSFLW